MPSNPPAEIMLALSPNAGIVAVAHGERYRWAETALMLVGFQRRDDDAARRPSATRACCR